MVSVNAKWLCNAMRNLCGRRLKGRVGRIGMVNHDREMSSFGVRGRWVVCFKRNSKGYRRSVLSGSEWGRSPAPVELQVNTETKGVEGPKRIGIGEGQENAAIKQRSLV
ncbi:hypothetical protein TRVL_02723 [Trypanosoma vivax]|nr:hypothetical protein TRVL_02723 [Trypanosoma vivax]